jgi:UDP-glucose 4-epimerase
MKRLAITGSSGYLGSALVEHFRQAYPDVTILGLDIREPGPIVPNQFVQADIRSPTLVDAIRSFQPDTVLHAAFAFAPMRNERLMREINVGGSTNLLQAVAEVRPARLLFVSSATAYGAWPDNPMPMPETWPLRARQQFRYAADKTEVESLVAAFAGEHPDITVSWVRPSIIGGPKMANYLQRFIFGMPFLAKLDGYDAPLQLVHESDVVQAIDAILAADARGAFNVAPPDWITISDIARETGRRIFRVPFWLAYAAHGLAWWTRFPLHESPAGFLYFVRYPWVVTPARLQTELGYKFRFSTLEVLRQSVPKRS